MPHRLFRVSRVEAVLAGDEPVVSPPEVRDDLLAVVAEVTACYATVG